MWTILDPTQLTAKTSADKKKKPFFISFLANKVKVKHLLTL